MAGGDIVVEAITSNSIELVLPSMASYAHDLSRADDKLRSFRMLLANFRVHVITVLLATMNDTCYDLNIYHHIL